WLAVNIAPGTPSAPDAWYSPSVEHSPIRTTSTPASVRPAANASTSAGPESRMSCPTTTRGRDGASPDPAGASGRTTARANAAPTARATWGLSWSGTVPRTSYALMRWERSVVTRPLYPRAIRTRRGALPAGTPLLPARGVPGLGARLGGAPPVLVLAVPLHGPREPLAERRVPRRPAQLGPQARRVDRVPQVVARAVRDELVVVAVAAEDLEGVPVEEVGDLPRAELLDVLVGAVVVGAVGDRRAHAERAHPRAHEQVARRLRRRVGRRRVVRGGLGEAPRVVELEVPVD